jgi:hypothetical protein
MTGGSSPFHDKIFLMHIIIERQREDEDWVKSSCFSLVFCIYMALRYQVDFPVTGFCLEAREHDEAKWTVQLCENQGCT